MITSKMKSDLEGLNNFDEQFIESLFAPCQLADINKETKIFKKQSNIRGFPHICGKNRLFFFFLYFWNFGNSGFEFFLWIFLIFEFHGL